MDEIARKVFHFEGFALDVMHRTLRHGSEDAELRPKSFDVLRYLVENTGRLVTKDEIIAAVWPKVIVTDELLTRCVSDVRLALRDRGQRIIKTVPRRGYVFASPVSEAANAALGPTPPLWDPQETDPPTAMNRRPPLSRGFPHVCCGI